MPDPSLPYAADPGTHSPVVRGGPPGWGPFVTATCGTVVGGGLLLVVWRGWLPMTDHTVPFVIVPGMIVAFTAAMMTMGWMFLLFGRFGRRTRWAWAAGGLIGVIILELFGLTYLAGIADAAAGR